ncbi:MAG: metal ABC transporter permease [Candidatus Micrarchaeota archaeon]
MMVFELLEYHFFQNAVMVAVLVSIASGIVGAYITVKRMSLITGSIAHGAFGGLGAGYFLGINPFAGAVAFSILSAFAITYAHEKARKRLDALLSLIWAFGMALGLLFIFMTPGYAGDLFSYLFGNILLVSNFDLILTAALVFAVVLCTALFYNLFLSVSFDEEYAKVSNMPVNFAYLAMFGLIALVVVMVIQVVGIVLMIGLLTVPAATAQLFERTIKRIMALAILISLACSLSGLVLAYYVDFPPGPLIILLISLVYMIGIAYKRLLK